MKATNKSTSRHAASTPAIVDPIFAAIEAHRAAIKLVRAMEKDYGHDQDEFDALVDAETKRLAELLAMTPTTPTGCAAVLRHVEAYDPDERLFNNWGKSISRSGRTLLTRLAAVIEQKAA